LKNQLLGAVLLVSFEDHTAEEEARMRNDEDPDSKADGHQRPKQQAGYPPDAKAALDQRAGGTKLSRHTTRILPTPIALRAEYNKLASKPKCGKRGAIAVLAKKYKVSESAVRKALEKKHKA
jgi:hypothetical protein